MYKSVCIHKIILVHVADVTYPWLTTSAKQYQDPCFGSLMESVNYQQCFLNFPFNLITVANQGEGPTPSYFWTKKIVLGDCHPLIWGSGWPLPPPPPSHLSQCLDPATGLANWTMAFLSSQPWCRLKSCYTARAKNKNFSASSQMDLTGGLVLSVMQSAIKLLATYVMYLRQPYIILKLI